VEVVVSYNSISLRKKRRGFASKAAVKKSLPAATPLPKMVSRDIWCKNTLGEIMVAKQSELQATGTHALFLLNLPQWPSDYLKQVLTRRITCGPTCGSRPHTGIL
jgi:hypothetical protein